MKGLAMVKGREVGGGVWLRLGLKGWLAKRRVNNALG